MAAGEQKKPRREANRPADGRPGASDRIPPSARSILSSAPDSGQEKERLSVRASAPPVSAGGDRPGKLASAPPAAADEQQEDQPRPSAVSAPAPTAPTNGRSDTQPSDPDTPPPAAVSGRRSGWPFYLKLFVSTFTLSAFTFGGGYVMVPLMKKRFVDQYHWIEEDEMLDLVALAQSSPGPMAVNGAILVGYRLAGIAGALVAIVGTVLPPLVILSIVSLFYTIFRDSPAVAAVLKGMQAGVAAVICDVVAGMGLRIIKLKKALPIAVMFLAFILAYFFNVNVIFIILACALLGGISAVALMKKKAGPGR